MTEPPAISPADAAVPVTPAAETFWGTVLRRLRYGTAVVISALLFGYVGMMVAGPPPQAAGVSLTVWPGHSALLAVAVLAVLLLVSTAIGSLLCHPDSPHQGLWCALLGLVALSARGGTSFMIIQTAQLSGPDAYASMCRMLALECVHWTVLFVLAETFARFMHDTWLPNTRWITRVSPEAVTKMVRVPASGGGRGNVAAARAGKFNVPPAAAQAIGFGMNMAIGALLLSVVLQSQAKGQVVTACFVSFLASTFLTGLAFPNVPALTLFLAVPATAAAGYLYAAGFPGMSPGYPGHPGNFFPRALPIDFIAAGVPGAISGYYFAFHLTLHSAESEKS